MDGMYRKFGFLFVCLFLIILDNNAQKTPPKDKVLKVGVFGIPPFVISHDSGWGGISIQLWEEVALSKNLSYRYIWIDSLGNLERDLNKGKYDLAIGTIPLNRATYKDLIFSFPYMTSNIGILSKESNIFDKLKPFFSFSFFFSVLVFFFLLTIIGSLFWIMERRKQPEIFSKNPILGVANGIWLSVVTMTSVGYGDIVPKTIFGRIIAAVWMIISLTISTSLIAGISSTLSNYNNQYIIQNPADFNNHKIGFSNNSNLKNFIIRHNGIPVNLKSMEEGYGYLKDSKIDAYISNYPSLKYFIQQQNANEINLISTNSNEEFYAFIAPKKANETIRIINEKILNYNENGVLKTIKANWLGDE